MRNTAPTDRKNFAVLLITMVTLYLIAYVYFVIKSVISGNFFDLVYYTILTLPLTIVGWLSFLQIIFRDLLNRRESGESDFY